MRRPGAAGTIWTPVGTGLPKGVLVYDLRYDYTQNVFTIGTLGRGVWSLTSYFRGGGGTGIGGDLGGLPPGGGTDVPDIPPQPPVWSPVSLLPPLDPNVSQNFIGSGSGAFGSQTAMIGIPGDGPEPLITFATTEVAVPVTDGSAILDGPAGLFSITPARKRVVQPLGDTSDPFGVGLFP
jgi:hypothetical protein